MRPADLQAPLPQVEEPARIQRVPQAAAERTASAAIVQGEPEVRAKQQDVVQSPETAPEQAENESRRRGRARRGKRRPEGAQAGAPEPVPDPDGADSAAEDPDGPPLKGSRLDLRGD